MPNDNTLKVEFDPRKALMDEIEHATEELKSLEPDDTFEVSSGNFIRTGLPILHGILTNTININTWLVWCEGFNREVKVIDDDTGETVIEIPKLFLDGHVKRDDPNSGVNSFDNRTATVRMTRSSNPAAAEKELFDAIGDAYETGRGDLSLLVKFNELFTKFGYQPIEIRMAGTGETVDASDPTNIKTKPVVEDYDANDGEEL